MHDWSAMV